MSDLNICVSMFAFTLAVAWWAVLYNDTSARKFAAFILARVQGRRAYNTAFKIEKRRREMELGLPANKADEVDELESLNR
jgi:hypothetical protein